MTEARCPICGRAVEADDPEVERLYSGRHPYVHTACLRWDEARQALEATPSNGEDADQPPR